MEFKQTTLTPSPGLAVAIGYYMSALDEVREQLCDTISGLSPEQLARRVLPGAHSIGALSLHVGEAEWWWMQCNIAGHKLTLGDRRQPFWDVLVDQDKFARKGYSASFCLEVLAGIRRQTRELLASCADSDLERIYSFTRRQKTTAFSLRWALHHLADHEAQHKGQILMLKRLLDEATTAN